MCYNKEWKIPTWVGYRIPLSTNVGASRAEFQPNPSIPSNQQAQINDYLGSGYDRGHLISVSDLRSLGQRAVVEANYLSTVAPQTLNSIARRGRDWNSLHEPMSHDQTRLFTFSQALHFYLNMDLGTPER